MMMIKIEPHKPHGRGYLNKQLLVVHILKQICN